MNSAENAFADALLSDTSRLRLARLTLADAPHLQILTNDPGIAGSIHFLPHPFELSDAEAIIARTNEQETFLGIQERESGALIGVLGVHLRQADKIEIGYWIGRHYHGHGYAAEAAAAVITALREKFPERMIIAECRCENIASWKTLEKLGFRASGEKGQRPGRDLLVLPTS